MTWRKSKVFYSSNKEITLDEVIFSSCIRKIESQLSWSGSSLGHKHRRGLRHLYYTSKKRFKDAVFALSAWDLPAGTTSEVTDHILGSGKDCFSLFWGAPWPLGLFYSSDKASCVAFITCGSEYLVGRVVLRLLIVFLISVLWISLLLQNLHCLISESFLILFSADPAFTLTFVYKLYMSNFPIIRCQLLFYFSLF